jgi:dCTP deaminase
LIVGPDAAYQLMPGDCVLGSIVEAVSIPSDVVACIEGKSSWARHFLTVHSAGFIDPGFNGDITLELKNDGKLPLVLEPGRAIAQISFLWLAAPALRPYGSEGLGSHYQYQKGPTESA